MKTRAWIAIFVVGLLSAISYKASADPDDWDCSHLSGGLYRVIDSSDDWVEFDGPYVGQVHSHQHFGGCLYDFGYSVSQGSSFLKTSAISPYDGFGDGCYSAEDVNNIYGTSGYYGQGIIDCAIDWNAGTVSIMGYSYWLPSDDY